LRSQHTSNIFESVLAELKICLFYSRKGFPYDSLHRIISSCPEKEAVNLRKYKDLKAAYNAIFEYIESMYNCKRIHASLHYRTPGAVYSECEKHTG